jgi:hypothetical protein
MAIEVSNRRLLSAAALLAAVLAGASSALFGACGPFTDVAADAFCPVVLEVFTLGITTGTTPTTYDPGSAVSRLQMATFLSRTVDGVVRRTSRRAAAAKFYLPQNPGVLGVTTLYSGINLMCFDGADLWVGGGDSVDRVRVSDGRQLETWTGVANAQAPVVAMGRILVAGNNSPGKLWMIDPRQPAGLVTTVVSNLPDSPQGIAFDGAKVWTANSFGSSLSIITPGAAIPWTVTNVNITLGSSAPIGLLFDGTFIWATDFSANTVVKLDTTGAILQTISGVAAPYHPVFDGTNVWVPDYASPGAVTVLRPASGAILQVLTGNGLDFPYQAAFDGERILVTNQITGTVSLWKAADMTPLGNFSIGPSGFPRGAASDGLNFWVTFGAGKLARF